jgi:hypothetical protein
MNYNLAKRSINKEQDFYCPETGVLFAVTFLIWIAVSLFNTGIFVFSYEDEGPLYEFLHGLRWTPIYHSPWLLITPYIFYVARKFPLTNTNIIRNLAIHLSLALIITLLTSLLHTYFIYIRLDETYRISSVPSNFLFYSVDRLLIYFAILLGYYGIDYYKKHNQEILNELKLQESISREKLNSFKNEIHPSFLLNTIGDIAKTLPVKPAEAEKIMADFAQVVCRMLQNSQKLILHIVDDYQFLEEYINLLGDRLQKKIEIRKIDNHLVDKNNIPISNLVISIIEEIISSNDKILQNFHLVIYELFETNQSYGVRAKLNDIDTLHPEFRELIAGLNGTNKAHNLYNIDGKTEEVNYSEEGTLNLSITILKQKV